MIRLRWLVLFAWVIATGCELGHQPDIPSVDANHGDGDGDISGDGDVSIGDGDGLGGAGHGGEIHLGGAGGGRVVR